MATDEFDYEFPEDTNNITNNRRDKRVEDLTEKLKAKDAEQAKVQQEKADAETKAAALEKERDFYSSFADSTSKYPNASEYKDAIKEKVMGGYSVDDAVVSVLVKEGKLNSQPIERDSPAGGSATNALQSDGPKSLQEMDRAEKRAELERAESEGGGLSQVLRSSR